MSTVPPNYAGPGVPGKKNNKLIWVLAGIAGFFVLLILLLFAGGLFVLHKARQAGIDSDLLQSNPAMAVGKMITALNPDLEVLKIDDARGTIRVRERKTGKTYSLSFDEARQGRIVLREDGKDEVTLQTTPGGVEVQSKEGTVRMGEGKAPDWLPSYPGAATEAVFAVQGSEGNAGTFHFVTRDPIERVVRFYEDGLKAAGFKVQSNTMNQDGKPAGGLVTGDQESSKRQVTVTIAPSGEETSVNVQFSVKP